MQRYEVLQRLASHRDELTKIWVKTLAIFRSVARDEARTDRDMDILVEFQGLSAIKGII